MSFPVKKDMMLLQTQDEFEQLIGRQPSEKPLPEFVVVYFTASWCGACKKLDLASIANSVPTAVWYKCDIDQNDYTAGFCGIRSIPSFLVIYRKQVMGVLSDSRTEKVVEWLKRFVA